MDEDRMDRIKDKIEEMEKYLEELVSVLPTSFELYKEDFKIRAICERYFERISEAATDLAFLIIKHKELKIPEEDKKAFDVLAEEKIISDALAEKFKEIKGMRNIIAHEYGKIEDELVFEAVTEELEKDVKELIKILKDKFHAD